MRRHLLGQQIVVETAPSWIKSGKVKGFALENLHRAGFSGRMDKKERQYCLFMDGRKRNRNIGCKRHDNAYGINGGGSEADRLSADLALYRHMRGNRDPMAPVVLAFTRLFGWFFFNYHGRPWRGQLVRKIFPRY